MRPCIEGTYMINTKTDYCIGIRLPEDVWKVVDEVSRQEYRTKNATIVLLLRNAIKTPKMESQYRRILEMQQKLLIKIEQVAHNGGPQT